MYKRNLLIVSCIGQAIMVLIIAFGLIKAENYQLIKQWLYLFIFLIAIFVIFNIISLYGLAKIIEKEKELAVIKTDFKNTEALIDLLRQQGHDHINHVQTVTSMLMLEEYSVAMEYLQGISEGYRFTGHFIRLGNPTLTALVNTKKEIANKNGIEFVVEKYCRVRLKKIKPWDISSIVGNLIENAIEYVFTHKDLPQRIYFYVENTEDMKGYRFRISNPYEGETVVLDKFFQKGFSSKDSTGRGYGLPIVKELVEKYNGTIHTSVSDGKIIFTVEVGD